MESKINIAFIESYSKAFSDKITGDYFSQKHQITGDELLELCKPRQINLFVLKELFYKWKAETSRLKSPWFDYGHEEVRNALTGFMNVLSRHISIGKEELRSLLTGAVEQTILLIFSPYEFYLKEFSRPGFNRISKENLYQLRKYVRINKDILDRFINKFEEDGIEAVFSDDAVRMFNEVCEHTRDTPEDLEPYLTELSGTLPIEPDSIYSNGNAAGSSPDMTPAEEKQLYEKFVSEEHKTLLDDLTEKTGGRKETIADQSPFSGEEGIKGHITINQRFMFVNELFSGNADEFDIAINTIENCQNRQEAIDFIRSNYMDNQIWEKDHEVVSDFIHMIEQYFPT